MTIDPDLEDALREYLRDARELDLRGNLRTIFEHQQKQQAMMDLHEAKDESRHHEVLGLVGALAHRTTALEERDRLLDDSDKKLADKLENSSTWTRDQLFAREQVRNKLMVQILFMVGGGVLGSLGTALVHYISTR